MSCYHAADAGTSLVTATTSVTSASGTANSFASTQMPSTSNALKALAGAKATLAQLKNLVNAQGNALTSAHLTALIGPGALYQGLNATQFAGSLASSFRGETVLTLDADSIISYDDANNLIDVGIRFVQSTPTGLVVDKSTMKFIRQIDGGNWLLYGNQRFARLSVSVESHIDHSSNGTVATKRVNVDIRPPDGLIFPGVTINCSGIQPVFFNTLISKNGTSIETFRPTTNPADNFTVTYDLYIVDADNLANYPSPGTVCDIGMVPLASAPVSYRVVTGGTTTETTTETTTLTTTPGDFAIGSIIGKTVTMNWTLPATFQITRIVTSADVENVFSEHELVSEVEHGPTAISGSVLIPPLFGFGGQTPTRATISLGYHGPNGERIGHSYSYN